MRIAFAGTPLFAAIQLQALLNSDHEVIVVYTQPDKPAGRGQHLQLSPVKTLALEHKLPCEQPKNLKTPEAYETLKNYQADVLIVAAYGLLLPEPILSLPRFGCINVHASILPRWRGASPIQQAILHGDKETGITLMRMDVGLDTGNILTQGSCPIADDETSESLHNKLAHLGANLLIEKLKKIVDQPGSMQPANLATHAPKITKEQAKIDWESPAFEIEHKIRAFNPWPIAHTTIDDQTMRVWQARVVECKTTCAPGTIISHTPEGIVVATGKEGLLITHLQLPGKKCLSVTEILRGHVALLAVNQRFISCE